MDTSLTSPKPRRSLFTKLAIGFALFAGLVACSGADESDGEDDDDDDSVQASSSEALSSTAGPCAGTAIDRAVRCAVSKGARILSFYRSPKDQERVRRENGCINRCSGSAGCVRPTAGCYSSPHTACRAVDLVHDGAPVTRSALAACGLGKIKRSAHANHYDLMY